MAIEVVLAEDHEVVRQAVGALLEREGECTVVGEAANGQDAIGLIQRLRPAVAVMDVGMPVMNGLEAAREIRDQFPEVRSILLTVHVEDSFVLEALEAGVRGYVVKTQCGSDLIKAIREVMRGFLYVSPHISRTLVDAFLSRNNSHRSELTRRERQVLQLTAEGKTAREIAQMLGFSARTVDSHRARIMGKLDINDRTGLVRYALRQGLVQP